jgi:hypothetical protein
MFIARFGMTAFHRADARATANREAKLFTENPYAIEEIAKPRATRGVG